MAEAYEMPIDSLSAIIFGSVTLSLTFAGLALSSQVRNERLRMVLASRKAKAHRLLYKSDHSEVEVPTIAPEGYHVFLSHGESAAIRTPRHCVAASFSTARATIIRTQSRAQVLLVPAGPTQSGRRGRTRCASSSSGCSR